MSPKVSGEYKEKKKKEIVMHAKKVFRRKGFEPTTMTDIKEEAKISFGGLYSYFSSTEEIFLQLLELEYKLNDDHMTMCQSDSVWDHVKNFLENQKSELRAIRDSHIPVSYEYFVSAWRETHRIPFLENRYKDEAAKLMQLLHAGIEKGEFRPSVPIEELSKMLISTLEGLNVSCLFLEEETIDIEGQIGTLQKLLEMALNVKDQ